MYVLTLNTWKCDGNYEERISRLESRLPSLNLDIILLQEVFAAPDSGADTARRIANCLPQHQRVLAPARPKIRRYSGRESHSTSGLAMLILGQVLRSRVLQLPGTRLDEDRIAQIVEVEIDGHTFQVVNLHLTHLRDEAALRREQLKRIFDELGPGPVLLGGDFNDVFESPALHYLESQVDKVMHSRAPTHGDRVIDYIAWRGLKFQGFEATLLFDGTDLPWVSDHAGVAVRFGDRSS